jgi:two-component system, NarL family, sensor kinase
VVRRTARGPATEGSTLASPRRDRTSHPRRRVGEITVAAAVARSAIAGLVALIVAAVVGILALRYFTTEQAIDDARELTRVLAQGIIEPNLTTEVLESSPAALESFDQIVRTGAVRGAVVRVKLWRADGLIIYSDEPRLIGSTYELGEDELHALRTGAVEAEASDLADPENRYERAEGQLLEVYLPVTAPGGAKLLFETYQRSDAISASSQRILTAVAPALLGALALLQLVHLPLAWTMARRLQRARTERELLLQHAIDASNAERRRIASDLHDGIVQDLAGIALSLSGMADRARNESIETSVEEFKAAASATRREIRELRTLLVEIHPPNLHAVGLQAALQDLLAPLALRNIESTLDVSADLRLPDPVESLLFRAAQEGLRNVLAHAAAARVRIEIRIQSDRARLELSDDGVGFSAQDRESRRSQGHFGLDLLDALVQDAGGEMWLDSAPERGTMLAVEVPIP